MRTLAPLLLFALAVPCSSRASDTPAAVERQTLEAALVLAGFTIAKLPIELASVAPKGASPGVEGWTLYRADGQGERIFVYSGSEIFRCASRPDKNTESHPCLLRLASVIVHEAWHFRNGRQETGAYTAQIQFLIANHASDAHIAAVQMARDRVLAAIRKAAKAARESRDVPR
jgi:hypothetical protein